MAKAMTQLVFEKRVSSAWIEAGFDSIGIIGLTFNQAFQSCINEFHTWPAIIVGCHLDESVPLAEFFVIEGGQPAEYRLREVEGND